MSAKQLEQKSFRDVVLSLLKENDYPPNHLCLEITERCRQLPIDVINEEVCFLQQYGIHFAMDDYGTGNASSSIVLGVPMNEIKIAQMGSSDDLVVGEQVVAIGNALGYGQSVTSGWISALNRNISTEDGEASGLIQTDAAINPGNSGGALLNMNGEVIGINAAKYADSQVEGMGYAIPISKAEPILEELMNRETRDKVEDSSKVGYMGVKAADLTTEAIQMYNMPAGAFITEVTEGGAADNAGIKKGDIIVKLDGQKVSGKDDLVDKLQYYEAGETIEVVISRANSGEYKEQTVEVTLGSKPSSDK